MAILSHGTMGQDGHRDTYIHACGKWDRLGYVPFFPHGTIGRDGHRDTYINTYMHVVNGTDQGTSHSFLWYNRIGWT